MKYAYFPGCVTPLRENAFELSARRVLEKLGIEIVELKGANCCGFFLDAVDHLSSSALAARNLCLAEEIGCAILTLCPTCSGHLTRVGTEVKENPQFRGNVNKILSKANRKLGSFSQVRHITRVLLEDVGIEKIRETIIRKLDDLRVAPHYGCHVMKPSDEIQFDSPENPELLDSLIELTGAMSVKYLEKRQCCGAPTMGVDEKLSLQIVRKKLKSIQEAKVDAIVTVCPFCHTHLDLNQTRIEEDYGESYGIPVLHYTQLLGLAQGYDPDDLGFYENRVMADKLLDLICNKED
jgi:heterodisulfide reductase subunit B